MSKIICGNCGAEFDENLPACPYCDALNPKGAEQKYMRDLGTIKKDLGHLPKGYAKEVAGEAKEVGGVLKKVAIGVGIVAAILIALTIWIDRPLGSMSREEEYLWKQEQYKTLDAYYEDGDLTGMLDAFEKAEKKSYAIHDWKHSNLANALIAIKEAEGLMERADREEGEAWTSTLSALLQNEITIECFDTVYPNADPKDRELVQQHGAALVADRTERFPMDDATKKGLINGSGEFRYVDYSACQEYVKKQFGRQ